MGRVLCVDDDEKKAREVADILQRWKDNPFGQQLEAVIETNFNKAVQRLRHERFDLVTLDLHAETDEKPADVGDEAETVQQGKRVLNELRKTRFVPVIFYSGYAEKIMSLSSLVVQVVKKGSNDLEAVRGAVRRLYNTGLPKLMRHIEEEQRSYIWDTVDRHAKDFKDAVDSDDLLYLLGRRIAARLGRESIKELLEHPMEKARPMEFYIYPPLPGAIKTGCIYGPDEGGVYWIVATPSCDFAQKKVEQVLMVGATPLATFPEFAKWHESRWTPDDKKPNGKGAYEDLVKLLTNRAGDRLRFLPGTFFVPPLVVDMQSLNQIPIAEFTQGVPVCTLDSPYRENLLLHLSKYYGRLGSPDLEVDKIFSRLAGLQPAVS